MRNMPIAADPIEPPPVAASYDVTDLSRHVPEAVGRARDSRQPVLITDQSEPLAAIVSIEELERLYALQERTEVRELVRDLEEAEARGDAEWYSMEQIVELQDRLLGEQTAGGHQARGDEERSRSG
jgi:prevent-host-death family protein